MNEAQKAQLTAAGIDVEDAMERFMHNEGLMLKFLLRFSEDQSMSQLRLAMEHQDADGAFEAAHTLKGVAGNLSMTGLFHQTGILVEHLRNRDLAAAADEMPALEEQYARVTAALAALG